MESYPSYKVSGVEWIGDIPSHWDKKSLRYSFDIQKGKIPKILLEESGENLLPYLSTGVLRTGIVNEYCDKTEGVLVEEGDLLILWDGSKSGEIFLGKVGILSSTMSKMDLYDEKLDRGFTFYLMKYYEKDFKNNTIGMGIPHMDGNHLKSSRIIIPPLSEQSQIVSFLDNKTQKIDDLIQKTEKKIELLKEKRTSLINHCVTKGLNSDVEMKDSGVEWIGDIPSHWVISRFKYQGEVIIGLSYKPENQVDEKKGVLVMRSSNVQNGKPSFEDNVYVDCTIPEKLRTRKGDILICSRNGSRRLIGKNCLITSDIEGMTWGVFMTMFRSPSYKFLYWLLNSSVFKSQSGLFLTSTINQLTVSTLENMIIPYVNDIEEQTQIVEYLNKKTQKIDSTIEKETQRIGLLKEYRQSLISEVVTGKVDVREWTE